MSGKMQEACQLAELTLVYRTPAPETLEHITGATDAARVLAPMFDGQHTERMIGLWLNAKNRVIGWNLLSQGGLMSAAVDPRAVFAMALKAGAVTFILAHNHPSGETDPSADDRQMNRRIADGGRLLGIPLLDSLIIGHDGRWYSAAQTGELPTQTT